MKKLITLMMLFFIVTANYAQQYNKFRMSDKQKKQLVKKGYTYLLVIEQFLDKNEEYLEDNKNISKKYRINELLNPKGYITRLKEAKIKNICEECYIEEYDNQVKRQNEIIQCFEEKEKRLLAERDSLRVVSQHRADSLLEVHRQKRQEENNLKSSVKTADNRTKNAYDNFIMSMDMAGRNEMGHRYFTVFCDIDLDFVTNRLGFYLQENGLTYDDDGYKDTGNKITYKFVPTVSMKNEYINITYSYIHNKELLSYATAITGSPSPCYQIKDVEIAGTKDIVLSLYLSYWGLQNLRIGGYKGNETSYNEFMGDYIAFTPINNKSAKITITKRDNIEMNYYKNFKIE